MGGDPRGSLRPDRHATGALLMHPPPTRERKKMSKSQCSAELPISNGVAYCIRTKDHDGPHRTGELTFGDSAAEAADEPEPVGYCVRLRCDDLPPSYQGTFYEANERGAAEEDAEAMRHGPGEGWRAEVVPLYASPTPTTADEIRTLVKRLALRSAADEITHLRAENERLRERVEELEGTLRPFAEHGRALEGCEPSDGWCEAVTPDGERIHWLAVEHFHNAARALTDQEREEDE